MKKYLVPVAMIGEHEVVGSLFVAYFLTGRFGLYKEFSRQPTDAVVRTEAEAKRARAEGDPARVAALDETARAKRADVVGEPAEWTSYRERFAAIRASAMGTDAATDRGRVFPEGVPGG